MSDILIVEDNPVNQKLIAFLLARAGYTYEVAENGAEALHRLDQSPFKLVLMDMMMPVMNGYDATKAIRANPKLKNLPVIALTANAMKGEDEKCRAAGCSDYLAKPYSKDQILNAISILIKKSQAEPGQA
ncbi:MAG: response regulator [Planctomycetes bacterium]|jgi:CheY-like chemotaxis protein|nr:response regulator [Planctomycetota bacterium]